MRFADIDGQPCSIARALSEIGDGWSLMILRDAFYGRRRFSDFVKFTGAQKTVVSDRLKRLVAAGVLERVEYAANPPRSEYRLTEKGRDLAPVLLTLSAWGDRWLDGGRGAPIAVVHEDCGHLARPRTACGHCDEDLHSRNVRATPGPGYPDGGPRIFREPETED